LANREACLRAPSGKDLLGQNAWAALCAAHNSVSEKPLSSILVPLFYQARTYFTKNF
jgi:hypothetical protein